MKITIEQAEKVETEVIIRCSDAKSDAISKIVTALRELEKQIPVKQTDTLTTIHPQNILYCEYVNRKVFAYTEKDIFTCNMSLQQLEEQFSDFVRCSKGAVVNIRQLSYLKSELHGRILATLSNGEQLLISRHYASSLRKRLKER